MSLFRTYISPSLGGTGWKDRLADVNLTYTQLMSVGGAFPGETCALYGNLYQVFQNRSGGTLAVGDALSLLLGDSTRTGNLTSASTPAVLTTDDTQDTNLSGNAAWPGIIGVTAGALATTADEVVRRILANTPASGASTVTIAGGPNYTGFVDGPTLGDPRLDPDAIGTIAAPPDNTYDYEVFCGWEMVKTDLDALVTSVPQGVCVSTTVTDDQFGIAQIGGICIAKVDGTTDLVAGDLLIPDSAAGVLSKWVVTTTDPTTAQVNQGAYVFGRILNAYTNNAVGLRLVQMLTRPLFPHPVTW